MNLFKFHTALLLLITIFPVMGCIDDDSVEYNQSAIPGNNNFELDFTNNLKNYFLNLKKSFKWFGITQNC